MAKPFDATLKHLVEAYPAAWLAGVGLPTAGPVRVIDADISTVTAGADKVLRVEETPPWIAHLELQAGPETDLGDRAHLYNVVLRRRHGVAVRTVLVLLRREADSPRLDGLLEHLDPSGDWERRWRYRVVRLWQLPADALLTGGLGMAPLAPLTDDAAGRLQEVIGRMGERLKGEEARERGELWAASYLLAGLRYPREIVDRLWKGVHAMEESATYQAVLEKGAEKGRQEGRQETLKETLLELGALRFGAATPAVAASLNSINDLERLGRMRHRLLEAAGWDDLLATP